MRNKYLSVVVMTAGFFMFANSSVFASGFYLKNIGSLDVEGTAYSQYWYTNGNLILTGMAPANTGISITVDGSVQTTTSDSEGNWQYALFLETGDHVITLSAESTAPYTFTLTTGEAPGEIGAIQKLETPAAGVGMPTMIFAFMGVCLTAASVYSFRKASM